MILLGNADFKFLMKAQITQKKIIFLSCFPRIMLGRDIRSSLQYFILLKSNKVKIYMVVKSEKLLLALSI